MKAVAGSCSTGEAHQKAERHLAEVRSPDYPGERLIVCHNPILAEHRRRKREALLTATEEALARIARQVARRTRTPLSATEIAEKVGRVKNRYKLAKHFRTEIADGSFHYERRTEAITREAQLDGFYLLRTSEPADRLPTAAVVRRYKDLTRVERAFRSLKTVDLHIRPIRHRVETRVRAHLFLCLLAYYVHWHLRQALAPLLFDDEGAGSGAGPARPGAGGPTVGLSQTEEGETPNRGRLAAAEPGDADGADGHAGSPPVPIALGTGRALRPAIDRAHPASATGLRADQNVPRQNHLRILIAH